MEHEVSADIPNSENQDKTAAAVTSSYSNGADRSNLEHLNLLTHSPKPSDMKCNRPSNTVKMAATLPRQAKKYKVADVDEDQVSYVST